ncbi:MAG: glycoside hydrolase family 3 C-terminal domain-containing protein [Chthoniobacterales bacterium]
MTSHTASPSSFSTSHSESSLEDLVENLLSLLTLEEKIGLVHGNTKFSTSGVPRLNIPERWLTDGPHGVREEISPDSWMPAGRWDDYATALPISLALAATWNPALALTGGEVLGAEARARKKDILLAPGVNIQRTPLCGRTFEYFGEDPFLTTRMAVNYIRGVQSQGVAACVKHLAVNNQEVERMTIDVEVDERTLREIYLPAFQAAVQEAGVCVVMGAYNKLRGQWCSHNDYLLNHILKEEWKFQGLVVSDWNAVHDTTEAVFNGLDLEMGTELPPDEHFLAEPFRQGILDGTYPLEALDEKVRRNLRVLIATGGMESEENRPVGRLGTPEHRAVAGEIAGEAIVLLKNEGALLPIVLDKVRSIAVIGENARRKHSKGGFGAGVKVMHEVNALEGIMQRSSLVTDVTYSKGYSSEETTGDLIERAVEAARRADIAIVFAGLSRALYSDDESTDRASLALPFGQDELISRVAAANPRTIVVMVSGSPVAMDSWIGSVPVVLQAWYGGVEAGTVIASVLFGDTTPSGKLPCTFPRHLEDIAAHAFGPTAYPGLDGKVTYEEGLMVGYRHFDTKGIEPLFAFGHGLSYTDFAYSDLELEAGDDGVFLNASFDLANIGTCRGAEVAQLYIQDIESSLPRPAKELKGFTKITLEPGERRRVTIPLDLRAFMFFHPEQGGWLAESGDFRILIGSSSRDLRLETVYHLKNSQFEPLQASPSGRATGDSVSMPALLACESGS